MLRLDNSAAMLGFLVQLQALLKGLQLFGQGWEGSGGYVPLLRRKGGVRVQIPDVWLPVLSRRAHDLCVQLGALVITQQFF